MPLTRHQGRRSPRPRAGIPSDALSTSMGNLKVVCPGESSQDTPSLADTNNQSLTFSAPRPGGTHSVADTFGGKTVFRQGESTVADDADVCHVEVADIRGCRVGEGEGREGGSLAESQLKADKRGGSCLGDHQCHSAGEQCLGKKAGKEGIIELFQAPALVLAPNGSIVFCNREFLRILGLKSRRSLIGRKQFPFDFMIHSETKYSSSSMDGAESELTLRHTDGTPVPVTVSYQATDVFGRGLRLACIRDMTVEMQKEEELREAKALLEGALKVKTAFLDKMSHELRTPLNGVVGVVDLLLGSVPVSVEQRNYLNTIRISAETLLAVLSDILDMCDIESSRMAIRPQIFSLHAVMQEASGILTSLAMDKGLQVSTRTDSLVPDLVEGDSQRVLQILRHLASNAVKFTERGHVSLEVSLAAVPARAHDRFGFNKGNSPVPSKNTVPQSQETSMSSMDASPRHCSTCACGVICSSTASLTETLVKDRESAVGPTPAPRKRQLEGAECMELVDEEVPSNGPKCKIARTGEVPAGSQLASEEAGERDASPMEVPEEGGADVIHDAVNTTVHVNFTVKDTGIGIEECEVERLFCPFVQGDDSHSRQATGAGLGLAITRSLVAALGGSISVTSLPGKGSAFTVLLPIRCAGDEARRRKTPPVCKAHASSALLSGTRSAPARVGPTQGTGPWTRQGLSWNQGRLSWEQQLSAHAKPGFLAKEGSPPRSSESLNGSQGNRGGEDGASSDRSSGMLPRPAGQDDRSGPRGRPRLRHLSAAITEDRPGLADLLASCQGTLTRVVPPRPPRHDLLAARLHPLDCRRPGMVSSISQTRAVVGQVAGHVDQSQQALQHRAVHGAGTVSTLQKAQTQSCSGLAQGTSKPRVVAAPAEGGSAGAVDSMATDIGSDASPVKMDMELLIIPPPNSELKSITPDQESPSSSVKSPTSSQLEQALANVPGKLREKFLSFEVRERVKALRCLIAEDNPVNRMVLQRMLRLVHLSCDLANNGAEAVQACQTKHYDIVFMDCQMPVMDGYEAARTIRGAKPRSCSRTQALCRGSSTKSTEGLDLSFSVLRKTPVPGLEATPGNSVATARLDLKSAGTITVARSSSSGSHLDPTGEASMDIFRITCKPSLEVDLGEGCSQGSCFWGSCECCPTVIAVTANVLQGSPGRCREAGMNGFIAKPVRLADVLHVLLRCIGVEP